MPRVGRGSVRLFHCFEQGRPGVAVDDPFAHQRERVGIGGAEDALWEHDGTDRLVLAIPGDTQLVTDGPTPPGGLRVKGTDGDYFYTSGGTQDDPFARYCVECGTSPTGRRTLIIEYRSADESVFTAYFYVTAFEELQVGVGPLAKIYRIDDVSGVVTEDVELTPFAPPPFPQHLCR